MATASTVKGLLEEMIDGGLNNNTLNTTPAYVTSLQSSVIASVTRPDNATPYTALDVVGGASSSILTFSDILPVSGAGFIMMNAWMKIAVNAVPSGMSSFRLHLYNASPTNIADNAAFNLPAGDLAKYLGYITLSTPTDLGDNIFTQLENINFKRKLAAASTTIYGMLQTVGGWTPPSLAVLTAGLETVGC